MPDYRLFAVQNQMAHNLCGTNIELEPREKATLWRGLTYAFGKQHDGWKIPDCSRDTWWDSNRIIITPPDGSHWMSLFKDDHLIYYSMGDFSDKKLVPLNPNNLPVPDGKVKLTIQADGTPLIEGYWPPPFELATWYNAWNEKGLDYLVRKMIPLNYATRYILGWGILELTQDPPGGYTIKMEERAPDVKEQILAQAPGAVVYVGLREPKINGKIDPRIRDAVIDNKEHKNRSTKNIVAWLQAKGYGGISIDSEDRAYSMQAVPDFVNQLGPCFKAKGLGLAVSVPYPAVGPKQYLQPTPDEPKIEPVVKAFNEFVDAVELQDYSFKEESTPYDFPIWTEAGVKACILMGGVCTPNQTPQTSLENIAKWTQFALENGLRGMFSWHLDNDYPMHPTQDVNPTFKGAKTMCKLATGWDVKFKGSPAVFPTNAGANLKSISVISASGRLVQLWESDLGYTRFWNFAFPAEVAGWPGRFEGNPAVLPTDPADNKMCIYVISNDKGQGQLVELCSDTNQWKMDGPLGGTPLQKSGVAVIARPGNKKSIYAINADGDLLEVWDTTEWNLDYPAKRAKYDRPFQGIPAAILVDPDDNKKSIYALTREEGWLVQVWNTDASSWTHDFPGGQEDLRFQNGVAVLPCDEKNKKSLYAIDTNGELVHLSYMDKWGVYFPLKGIKDSPLLQGIPAVFPLHPGQGRAHYIVAVTRDGKLVYFWDFQGEYQVAYPVADPGIQFQGSPAAFVRPDGKMSIYAISTDNRLVQVWEDNGWQFDFPAEEV